MATSSESRATPVADAPAGTTAHCGRRTRFASLRNLLAQPEDEGLVSWNKFTNGSASWMRFAVRLDVARGQRGHAIG